MYSPDFCHAPNCVQSTPCEKVGDAVDVATLSGATMKRYVNSTMTASPANLKTKTSSPAERKVVGIYLVCSSNPINLGPGVCAAILFCFLISQGHECGNGFELYDGNIKGRGIINGMNKVEDQAE